MGGPLMGNGLAVERASPHSGLGSGSVALPAEHVAVQGEAAIVVRLNGQRLPTVLGGRNRKNTLVEKAPVHPTHPHFYMRKAKCLSSNGPEQASSLSGFPGPPPTATPVLSPSLLPQEGGQWAELLPKRPPQ